MRARPSVAVPALALALIAAGAAGRGQTPPPRAKVIQTPPPPVGMKVVPKLEPIAETKLLMEGMANPNFRGLDKLLTQKPAEAQAWVFGRGQALLIAETANLLMLRPPKTQQAQTPWFERAMDLRQKATALAREVARRDEGRSRAAFVALANSCNRCHQSFRVPVEVTPFAEAAPPTKTE